ncbi:MAG: flagellar type III secretion system pore protein FliP [Acidimicrobiales bacterium]
MLASVALAVSHNPTVNVNIGQLAKPSTSLVIIISLTLLAVAPAALILLTPFTQAVVVLKIAANALGLNNIPPRQVLTGLALFLALAVMAPTLGQVNHIAVQPWLHGKMSFATALTTAEGPFRTWMLHHTRTADLHVFLSVTGHAKVAVAHAPMSALIPAYTISQLESAMVMGFMVFIPFVIIDLIVASTLMSIGIVMLPPTLISLPFKLLLFVLVDGWRLVSIALLKAG